MRYDQIRHHLRPYVIRQRRAQTINHAFAAAVAPHDTYNDSEVRRAIQALGQDPDEELACVYCGSAAETWDHVFPTVRSSRFSGHGNRLGNLVPCCKPCNSQKGNKHWEAFMQSQDGAEKQTRLTILASYIEQYRTDDEPQPDTERHRKLEALRLEVLRLCGEADAIAAEIRAELGFNSDPPT